MTSADRTDRVAAPKARLVPGSRQLLSVGSVLALTLGLSLLVPLLHRLERHELAIALVTEDGLYETWGAAACLAASGLLAARWLVGRNAGQPWSQGWATLALAAGMALMFAEEISWGQRVLGLATPDWIRRANLQGELNLHNLRLFHPQIATNWLKLVWLLVSVGYLGLWPIAAGVFRPLARIGQRFAIPVAGSGIALAALLGFLLYGWQTDSASRQRDAYAGHDAGEAVETLLETLYALLAAESLARSLPAASVTRRRWWLALAPAGLWLLVTMPAVIDSVRHPTQWFDGVAWLRLGQLQAASGESLAAIESLARAAQILPERAEPLLQISEVHLKRGETEAAAQVLQIVVRDFPDEPIAWFNLGAIRIHQARWSEAIAAFTEVLRLEPENFEACYQRGVALSALGKADEAQRDFRRTLELRPDYAPARQRLGG